ncbi:hypothetical protein BIFGAL_03080 [Bifidobacterium gallicum DSM 20093 = LMG 11596]|uniref:Uncharacterized protein n=1 Tax=Bifidobacterium gallicum DSM 20093 = LMG 11596 TaxID=561180 RepID=D1NTC3_9BIFI|nr:hypothetical protein BIFGAL_03080 [Bifidobacterium gallicum DSM 20093 = LMG 11596]
MPEIMNAAVSTPSYVVNTAAFVIRHSFIIVICSRSCTPSSAAAAAHRQSQCAAICSD